MPRCPCTSAATETRGVTPRSFLGARRLRVVSPINADPSEGMDTLTPVAPHTFRIESSNGFGAPGELAISSSDRTATRRQ